MENKGDMTKGSPGKLIFAFSVPMILGNVIQQLYSMTDAAIVGRFVGKGALAAIGATQSVLNFLICLIIGMAMGTSIALSQSFGAGNLKRVRDIVGNAIYTIIGLSVFIATAGWFGVVPVLKLLDTPAEIIPDARIYLLINTCTGLWPIAYNITANFMRAVGDSKSSLYAVLCSSIMNVALDLLFVIGFHWGVAGASAATSISQMFATFVNLWLIKKKHEILHITRENLRFRPDILKNIIRIGLPMAVQSGVTSVGMMGVQSIVNRYGTDVVAAYTAAGKIDQISMMPLNSLGFAVSTYMGQNYGKGDRERIRRGVRAGMLQALAWGLGLMVIILIFGGRLTALFVSAKETEVIAVAREYLNVIALFYWLCGMMYVMLNTFRGMGRMTLSTVASCLEPAGKLVSAYILGHVFGRVGVWFGWPIGWLCGISLPLIAWFKQRGREEV